MKKNPQSPAKIEILTRSVLSSIPQLPEEKTSKFKNRLKTPMLQSNVEDRTEDSDLDEVIGWLRKAAEPDDAALCDIPRSPKGRELGRF